MQFGIDTAKLLGKGFKKVAKQGQRVKIGDTVLEVDLSLLNGTAKSDFTPVVITNMDEIIDLIKSAGSVTAGETAVMRVRITSVSVAY